MNLLTLIQERSTTLPPDFGKGGIDAVVAHIETAEAHWLRAKKDGYEALFTDVVYRTNQAFEGILKEAYSVLTSKDATKKNTYEIEEYLEKGNLFRERVLKSFNNYRTEWRNKSTHDHKLFFSEQEALLAINSVSAFCLILLDQIVTKSNERYENERATRFAERVKSSINNYSSLSFQDKVSSLLVKSYEFIEKPAGRPLSEGEFVGLLSGFISAIDNGIEIRQEVVLNNQTREIADLIISGENTTVVVEVKRRSLRRDDLGGAERQVLSYMQLAETRYGIIMFFDEAANEGEKSTLQSLFDDGPLITYVKPKVG